jgi:hypothetical protein
MLWAMRPAHETAGCGAEIVGGSCSLRPVVETRYPLSSRIWASAPAAVRAEPTPGADVDDAERRSRP